MAQQVCTVFRTGGGALVEHGLVHRHQLHVDLLGALDRVLLPGLVHHGAELRRDVGGHADAAHTALGQIANGGAVFAGQQDEIITAIITYTSGSTGKPKGAVNTREGLENRWNRVFLADALESADVIPLVSPWRFPEQLAALTLGIRQECFDFRALGPARYAEWLRDRHITGVTSYLGVFQQLMSIEGAVFPDLRKYVVIGEPLLHADLELFNQRFTPGSFIQGRFGTSEHGSIAVYNYYQGDPIDFEVILIGRPLEPETVRLLAPDGAEVPTGQQGEIVIASPVLADGYHNDAERSASVYRPDPANPGRLLYYTGDLAYTDHLGRLRGLGRKDQQIKIRGYNVRPSEIEQLFLDHPGVASVAVASFAGPKGELRLACHFAAAGSQVPTAEELRAYVAALVPSYQVPVAYLAHDALPLLNNGKVNRQVLPNPLVTKPRPAGWSRAWPISGKTCWGMPASGSARISSMWVATRCKP